MPPHRINAFAHLVQRLETKAVTAMIEESKENAAAKAAPPQPAAAAATTPAAPGAAAGAAAAAKPSHPEEEPLAPTIGFEQFTAVDLRIARVLTAEPVEKSDKLMKLTLDVGYLGQRTVLAGIKKAYTPERLVGRLVMIAANLAPRTMGKFGTSEGMICACGPGPVEVFVLSPDTGAKPGQRVH
jgi:methionyl-tRNA synthetase